MGSFEKLVVLTVIFLASVIVAVTFQSNDDTSTGTGNVEAAERPSTTQNPGAQNPGAQNPGAADRPGTRIGTAPTGTTPSGSGANNGDRAPQSQRPNPFAPGGLRADGEGLLSATGAAIEPSGGALGGAALAGSDMQDAGAELPELLATATGLMPGFGDNGTYYYTVETQDLTWTGLSERFYGTSAHADLLRRENAAVGQPVPNSMILVPSRTDRSATNRTQPHEARAPGRPAPQTPKTGAANDGVAPPTELTGQTFRTHVVAAGETLTGIAFHYYQRASLWRRIHDANLDVVSDPDRLVQGTVLRIP